MPNENRTELQDAASPVEILKGEEGRVPEKGAALCLSGGGYRAMVFHVGVPWRLYEANMLRGLKAWAGSLEFAKLVLEERLLAPSPGFGFGKAGKGYLRCSLTQNELRIRQACHRTKNARTD